MVDTKQARWVYRVERNFLRFFFFGGLGAGIFVLHETNFCD